MAKITNRVNRLLATIELETGNRPTQEDVAEGAGIGRSTLSRIIHDKTQRYDAEVLIRLVDYFDSQLEGGCTLADLLVYEPGKNGKI